MFLFATTLFFSAVLAFVSAGSVLTSSLVQSLIASDDIDVRPDADFGPPVVVSASYTLMDIEKLKDRDDLFRVYGYLSLTWKNNRLTWNPSDYGNLTVVRVPSAKIWKPDIVAYSNVDFNRNEMVSENVLVYNTGMVLWVPQTKFTIRCNSTSHDASEEISCKIPIASWVYDESHIDVESSRKDSENAVTCEDPRYRMTRGSIVRTSLVYPCCAERYPRLEITFTAVRVGKNLA